MLNNEEFFKAFDWDDEIENENEFELLPEGTYNFVVESFTRGEHPGSDKLPPCKKAILGIRCTDDKGHEGDILHNLFLHSKCEGTLSAFFISIGQKKHGEKVRMNWNAVIGAKGKCKVKIKPYNGKDYNNITAFLDPEKIDKPSASSYGGF